MPAAEEVNTKAVANRREVSYYSYDDLLADAERLAGQDVQVLGNWSLAQIVDHLGRSLDASIDGIGFELPWPMRVFGSLVFKNKYLNVEIPPGFKIGKNVQAKFMPESSVEVTAALDRLRKAIERCKTEPTRAFHPLFGNLSREDWDKFSLRHAEMHMSFALSKEN